MNRLPASCPTQRWAACAAAVLSVTALALAAAPAQAAEPTSCGSLKPHGITALKATATSCVTAGDVARNYSYERRTRGWSCEAKPASSNVERVTCKRGARRVTFRSTLAIELPAAPALPSAGGAR